MNVFFARRCLCAMGIYFSRKSMYLVVQTVSHIIRWHDRIARCTRTLFFNQIFKSTMQRHP